MRRAEGGGRKAEGGGRRAEDRMRKSGTISQSRLKHENSDLSKMKKFSNYVEYKARELGMLSQRI